LVVVGFLAMPSLPCTSCRGTYDFGLILARFWLIYPEQEAEKWTFVS
jgi:hypothetical protein